MMQSRNGKRQESGISFVLPSFSFPLMGLLYYVAPSALRWVVRIEMIGLTPYPWLFRTFGAKLNREKAGNKREKNTAQKVIYPLTKGRETVCKV